MIATDEIKEQIAAAIAAHGKWKWRLEKAIDKQSSEFEVETVRSPHDCEFGKWLDGHKDELQSYEEYAKICDVHAQVHEETARVMELALAGNKDEARKSIAIGSHFGKVSAELTTTMMRWKRSL